MPSPSGQGSLVLNDDGSFLLIPQNTLRQTRTFLYRASDGTQDSPAATVEVTSGVDYEADTIYRVELPPWLHPGPLRFDCVSFFDEGSVVAQTYGAGSWEPSGRDRSQFEARLDGAVAGSFSLQGERDERGLTAVAIGVDGQAFDVTGLADAECDATVVLQRR